MQKLIDFKGINYTEEKEDKQIEDIRRKDIAVIGIAASLGGTKNTDELWNLLSCGETSVRVFPENRRIDIESYLNTLNIDSSNIDYHFGAYVEKIDKFDHKFFSISLKEASLMDPNQRKFLETAWSAIEDAGYGGEKLSGKDVGVFLGYSSDFGEEYKKIVHTMEPESVKLSTTGNIKSIISSRISYLLDLHGPSMVIDTACSSSLVAVHEACNSIRKGECEAAIAGGVKILMAPVKAESHSQIGIQILNDIASSDGKTKTFDNRSDGTVLGEGVAAILLKPFNRAIEDRDHIYAIIKGSSVNQDGSSIGITAPNSTAQEKVICAAWEDAGIDPESISYIEAHGTGTRLGDTVEINGLDKAFRNYTDKVQFCAVGSIKTNIGHLDCTAGISGLLKAVLSLSKKKIPPSINFSLPNRNIPMIESPVYINDQLADWVSKDTPRRCGVSSFGLSGTNCHMILEEAPVLKTEEEEQEIYLFVLSAKSEQSLKRLVIRYLEYFQTNTISTIGNICFTANTGRGHYQYRLAIIVKGAEDLECKLAQIYASDYHYNEVTNVFYGEHKVVYREKQVMGTGEVTEREKTHFTEEANKLCAQFVSQGFTKDQYSTLSSLYVLGADIPWDIIFQGGCYSRVSLPSYAFDEIRCWVGNNSNCNDKRYNQYHAVGPLIDTCIAKSMNLKIYMTLFQTDKQWVLKEHKVFDSYVVPGTAYIEMLREALWKENNDNHLVIKDLKFITPLALEEGESKEVHLIIRDVDGWIEYVITSKDRLSGEWMLHVEGKAVYDKSTPNNMPALEEIKSRFTNEDLFLYKHSGDSPVKTGPRWDTYAYIYKKTGEFLSYIQLKDIYQDDLIEYKFHPSMMDCAVNTAITLIGEGVYLPFFYKCLTIYSSTPSSFYCYLKRKDTHSNDETAVFDILCLEEQGNIFLKIEDYVIKKVRQENSDSWKQKDSNLYHQIKWVRKETAERRKKIEIGRVLVVRNSSDIADGLIKELKALGMEVIEVYHGKWFQKKALNKYIIKSCQMDYNRLIQEVGAEFSMIIHMPVIGNSEEIESTNQLDDKLNQGVYSLLFLTKAMAGNEDKGRLELFVISDYSDQVSTVQKIFKPENTAMLALAKVLGEEHSKIVSRTIDLDNCATGLEVFEEIMSKDSPVSVAFREKIRYVQEFKPILLQKQFEDEIIRKNGVYVITGGTGGLGLEIARYIAKSGVKIALLSRSGLPNRKEWASEKDGRMLKKINAVKAMEAMGAEIEIYSVDITKYEKVKEVLSDLRLRHKKISGVFHCAGIAGDGFLFRKEETVFRNVIEAKIKGTWILDKLTKEDNLQFFVMFSSISAVLPMLGQGDYTAANAFMDTFAYYMKAKGRNGISIRWAPWKEEGMAVDYNIDMEHGAFEPISNIAGLSALENIIKTGENGVIVGGLHDEGIAKLSSYYQMHKSLNQSVHQKKFDDTANKAEDNKNIVITGKQKEDLSKIELKVAAIWAKFLCLESIDIYDSFYSMGGDSVIATVLLKEMDKVFPDLLDVTDIFTYPSVVDISEYIEQKIFPKMQKKETKIVEVSENLTIEKIVEKLSQNEISPEEADQMIKRVSNEENNLELEG